MGFTQRMRHLHALPSPGSVFDFQLLLEIQRQIPSARINLVDRSVDINECISHLKLVIPDGWKLNFNTPQSGADTCWFVRPGYYIKHGWSRTTI